MCGIVGSFGKANSVSDLSIKEALASLSHRGPDGEGSWFSRDQSVALGHCRLSIIDLESGQQPLFNEDENIFAVVNGEFYDYQSIRRALEQIGHQFRTKTDAEILLHLYEQHGEKCLKHLRGEFAFLLWDETKKRLFAARDRFGIKPFCYASLGDRLIAASEAKALFALGLRAKWDDRAFYHAFTHQYVPPTFTLFDKVQQLPPGHLLLHSAGKTKIEKYWDWNLPYEHSSTKSFEDYVTEVSTGFDEAVRLRLVADVPVAFHLSGGLDSSSVVCSALRSSSSSKTCFTVAFNDDHYNELPVAKEFASHIGAKLIAVQVKAEDLIEALPNALYHSEGFAINGHLPAKYLLSRQVQKSGFKVVLTGEGADEVFLGYPHLKHDNNGSNLNDLLRENPEAVGIMLPDGEQLSTDTIKDRLGYVPSFIAAKAGIGFRLHQLLDRSFSDNWQKYSPFAELLKHFDVAQQLRNKPRVMQSAYLWSKLALTNYILRTLGDGTEMAHSVEGRLPFLDHHLFETVKKIPVATKMDGEIEKKLLRHAYGNELTNTVRTRRKQPFLAPPMMFSQSKTVRDMLADLTSTIEVPFFDKGKLTCLIDDLPRLSKKELVSLDPVLMTALSTLLIQKRFGLT